MGVGLILKFFGLLALITHVLGLGDKGNWQSTYILTWIQFWPVTFIYQMTRKKSRILSYLWLNQTQWVIVILAIVKMVFEWDVPDSCS